MATVMYWALRMVVLAAGLFALVVNWRIGLVLLRRRRQERAVARVVDRGALFGRGGDLSNLLLPDRIRPTNLAQCMNGGCMGSYVIPYAYHSHTAACRRSGELQPGVHIGVFASVEEGLYDDQSYILATGPNRDLDRHPVLRHDWRYGGGFSVAFGRGDWDATFRYDLLVSRSNVDNTVRPLDYDNKNYVHHMLSFEVAYEPWISRGVLSRRCR